MNEVKNIFSIKDLENLSGIKSHTIRIWEKRYGLLEPARTNTNIRMYDLESLQKLLNTILLNSYGHKISKISTYSPDDINELVNQIIANNTLKTHVMSEFKIAMFEFNQELFLKTYNRLIKEKTFSEIFYGVFIPFMQEIGLLWQTNTISPAHEHFVSFLIKQKLLIETERIQVLEPTKKEKIFVLSLPSNEIHELGLLFLNYEILSKGYKTIYLGESMPISSLKDLKQHFDSIVYVSYFTIEPTKELINDYIKQMIEQLGDEHNELWFIGRMVEHIKLENTHNERINIFNSIESLVNSI